MLRTLKKHKYFCTILAFIVWMLFFDSNDFFYIAKQKKELNTLNSQKKFLTNENLELTKQSEELFSSKKNLEKFARERYFFKKANEDIYILEYQKK
jgi:cell division protein FtsB